MANKRLILVAVLVAFGLGSLAWWPGRLPEPIYQGKPLSVWLDQYGTNIWAHPNADLAHQSETAIRQIGTNAAPILVRMMSSHESFFIKNVLGRLPQRWLVHLPTTGGYQIRLSERRRRGAYGFIALGPDARPFIPDLVHLLGNTNSDVRYVSVFTLRCLGPVAKEALPSLIKCLDDPEFTVRDDAVMGLGTIHENPERTIPSLLSFIEKNRGNSIQNSILFHDAMESLGRFGTKAESAVPVVLLLLEDENPDVRSCATNTLKAIDPATAAKAGVQ